MKKLLVLLVVLGLVSAANAAVIDIQLAGGGHEITVMPSDTVNLEIIFTAPDTEALFNLAVYIDGVVQGKGTLGDLNTGLTYATGLDTALKLNGSNFITIPANTSSGLGYGPMGTGSALVVVGGITIHCDLAPNDLIVSLSNYMANETLVVTPADGGLANFSLGNGVVIHQVPEPMTMMLLGLGSLFLVRRKK